MFYGWKATSETCDCYCYPTGSSAAGAPTAAATAIREPEPAARAVPACARTDRSRCKGEDNPIPRPNIYLRGVRVASEGRLYEGCPNTG